MARQESPREDLLREAVALVRRIELECEGESAPVVIGFRRDGSASVFFGDDPVVQFNARNELRRGFDGGRLVKAEKGRLASLTRVRTDVETQLVRHDLTDRETADYLAEVERRLFHLRETISAGRFAVLRQMPEDEDVCTRVRNWLEALPTPLAIARSPHAGS